MFGSEWSTQENRSGKLYLFDICEHKGEDLRSLPYYQRHELLRKLKRESLPSHWSVIENYPTLQIDSIWLNLVESGKFEGVVFRGLEDPWSAEIPRAKLTKTIDLRIVDFERGNGQFANCLGALVAVDEQGITHSVGGGLTTKMRKEIWSDKEKYRGRVFVCECKKIFESGKLRHPNFVEWHADKD